MSRSANPLLRDRFSNHRICQVLVPLLAVVAVLVGLLALHSLGGTAHAHSGSAGTAASAGHHHDHSAAHDHGVAHEHATAGPQHEVAAAVQFIGPEAPRSPECPAGAGLECCVASVACVMVLALLSVSIAIGGGPAALAGAAMLLAVVAAFTLRAAPVRPPSLAQLSTLRI